MVTISHVVQKIVNNNVFIQETMTRGIVSYGSLAEQLKPEIKEELGIQIEVGRQLTTIEHAYTHFRITLHAFRCQWLTGKPKALDCQDYQWGSPKHFSDLPFSKADRKIIALL